MAKFIYCIFFFNAILLVIPSCKQKNETVKMDDDPIVTVLDHTLYRYQLDDMMPHGLPSKDSITIAEENIKNWIDNVLIYEKAKRNIINKKNIDELVENYRQSLIIHSYQEDLVRDRAVKEKYQAEDKLFDFYNDNKSRFLLKEPVIKGLYLKVPVGSPQLSNFRKLYTQGTEKAVENIDKNSLQNAIGYDYFYNKWVNFDDVLSTIPHQIKDEDQFLKNNKTLDIQDSLYVYLLHVKEYKLAGEVAPFEFVKDNIIQIIRERDRNSYLKQIRADLYDKAIADKEIKFYNK